MNHRKLLHFKLTTPKIIYFKTLKLTAFIFVNWPLFVLLITNRCQPGTKFHQAFSPVPSTAFPSTCQTTASLPAAPFVAKLRPWPPIGESGSILNTSPFFGNLIFNFEGRLGAITSDGALCTSHRPEGRKPF